MSDDFAICVQNLTKTYRLYDNHFDRLKESLHPLGKKYHHDFKSLNDVTFEIKKGESLGIIGKNGSGKSTLLKLIAGVLTPTSGSVVVNGRMSALLELGAGFNPEMTGLENIYFNGTLLGYNKEAMDQRLDAILSFADIGTFVHQPVKTYSSGMFVRLAFSVATVIEPDILVVDEALSVGDIFFQQKCYARLEKLKQEGVTILLVTHSSGDVIQFCNKSIVLNEGRMIFVGDPTEAVKRYLVLEQKDKLDNLLKTITNKSINTSYVRELLDNSSEIQWPDDNQFLELDNIDVVSSSRVRCTRIALCSADNLRANVFLAGETARLYCEFVVDTQIAVPIVGFTLINDKNIIIHGKNTLHYNDINLPSIICDNTILRFRFDIELTIAVGEYTFNIGMSTMSYDDFKVRDMISMEQTQAKTLRLCHLSNVGSFSVAKSTPPISDHSKLHAGICNLHGGCMYNIFPVNSDVDSIIKNKGNDTMPSIFHVTHWKAGSQWIKKIIKAACPDQFVESELDIGHFLRNPLQQGKIYTAVYVTKEQFDSVNLPLYWRRFIVIRDLRDTLVSAYFSLKVSHSEVSSKITDYRDKLNALSVEDGLLYLIDEWLYLSANIQQSWINAGEQLIKYEDLLENDVEILTDVLINKCQLNIDASNLVKIIENNRFEELTFGRKKGEENIMAHERKGVAGDWKNHFTPKVVKHFKQVYGDLLIKSGYEVDDNW